MVYIIIAIDNGTKYLLLMQIMLQYLGFMHGVRHHEIFYVILEFARG